MDRGLRAISAMAGESLPSGTEIPCALLVIFVLLFAYASAALAHTPHDVIDDLEVSPEYDTDHTIYIIVRYELLKSVDGGRSFIRLIDGLDNKHDLSSLDLSRRSKKILYVASHGDGVYWSEDEGESWVNVSEGLTNRDIRLLFVSPRASGLVFAIGAGKEIFRTTDGGQHWSQVFAAPAQPTALAFLPGEPERVVVGDERGALYASRDAGESWRTLGTLAGAGAIRAIAGSPAFAADRTFFVGTEKAGVFKSADGGKTFAPVNDGLADLSVMSLAISPDYAADATLFASTWHDGVFAFDARRNAWEKRSDGLTTDSQADDFGMPHFTDVKPSAAFAEDGTMFLAAYDGLFTTTDGGRNWTVLEVLPPHIITGLALSPNFGSDSTLAMIQYFAGAYLSKDKGESWRYINDDLRGRCDPRYFPRFRKFEVAFAPAYPADPRIFTTTWWGILRTTVGSTDWEGFGIEGVGVEGKSKGPLPLPKLAFSPDFAADQTMFAGTRHGELFRSTDGGKTFSIIAGLGRGIRTLVISPEFPSDRTLFAVTQGAVERSTDGGFTWQAADRGLAVNARGEVSLAISPGYGTDRTLFAGTPEGLFTTTDGAESWRRIDGAAIDGSSNILIVTLSPQFVADRTLVVNVKGKGLLKSVDGGESFTRIGAGLIERHLSPGVPDPFSEESAPLRLSPSFPADQTIFGFSRTTLFRSVDGGESWTVLDTPIPEYDLGALLHCAVALNDKHRYATALLAGVSGYFLVGFVGFRERSLLGRWPPRALGGIAAFGVVLAVL